MTYSVRNTIIAGIIVVLIAQVLNAVLAVSSFEQTYRTSLIANFKITARDLKHDIETGVNFGKPITLYNGMEALLDEVTAVNEDITAVFVTLPDRKILYSTDRKTIGRILGSKDFPDFGEKAVDDEASGGRFSLDPGAVTGYKNAYFISIPIYYNNKALVGIVHLQFNKSVIQREIRQVIKDTIRFFLPILGGAIGLLILLQSILAFVYKKSREEHEKSEEEVDVVSEPGFLPKLHFSQSTFNTLTILLVLVISQLLYAYYNNGYFRRTYVNIFYKNIQTLCFSIKDDLEYVLKLGIPVQRLKKADVVLGRRLANNAEALEILVTDMDGNVLYLASRKSDSKKIMLNSILEESGRQIDNYKIGLSKTQTMYIEPLVAAGYPGGHLAIMINEKSIKDKLTDILYDEITVIVVCLIFSFELLLLLTLFLSPAKLKKTKLYTSVDEESRRKLSIIRITSFIFFFAALMPLSFLPLLIKQIYEANPITFFNLSKETILSLPISSYMIGIAIIIPIIGFISDRLSIRHVFFISAGIFMLGSLATAFATNMGLLILARFVAGLGYGAGVINSTGLIVKYTDSSNRTTGFGNWSAGFAAATICAISIGGVIVYRLGFQVGMLITTVFAFLLVVFIYFYIRIFDKVEVKKEDKPRLGQIFEIFKNRSLVANLIFSSIPIQLAYVGLFQYVFPLYMNEMNISQSNIGRILTIYGLISLLTPFVARASDKIKNEKLFIILGNLITGVFLLSFFLYDNILAMVITIIAMGVGSMTVDAVNESFIVSSKEARHLGETKLLSIYITYEKIVAVIVPVIAGILITGMGFSYSIGVIGIFTVAGSIMFAFIGKNMRYPGDKDKSSSEAERKG